jgi:hypothetical protein
LNKTLASARAGALPIVYFEGGFFPLMNHLALLAQSGGRPPDEIQAVIVFALLGIVLAIYIFMGFCLQKIAQKTGTESSWMAYVPILQILLMLKVADKPSWYLILCFVPLVNLIMAVMIWVWIAETLGRSKVIAALCAITSVGLVVLLPFYAFSDD